MSCFRNILLIALVFGLAACSEKKPRSAKRSPELMLIDEVFIHTAEGENDKRMGFSIFPLPDSAPSNWEAPFNYSEGMVYYRLAVLRKPDSRLVYYQMGFQWEEGCDGHPFLEKFPSQELLAFTDEGIYEGHQAIPDMWEPDCQHEEPLDWTRRIDRLLVVMWNENFRPIDDRWGYGSDVENIYGYFPMEVHFQAVVVPSGFDFSGWENYEITIPD